MPHYQAEARKVSGAVITFGFWEPDIEAAEQYAARMVVFLEAITMKVEELEHPRDRHEPTAEAELEPPPASQRVPGEGEADI